VPSHGYKANQVHGKKLTSDSPNCDLPPHILSDNMDSYRLHYGIVNHLSYVTTQDTANRCLSLGTKPNCDCYGIFFNHPCYDIATLGYLIRFYEIILKRLIRLKCTILFNFEMKGEITETHWNILLQLTQYKKILLLQKVYMELSPPKP
jgi:hypothetical protein